MKDQNLNLLASLVAFAVNAEERTEDLTSAEIGSKLQAHGLDLMKLDAATVRRLKKLRKQLDSASGQQVVSVNKWSDRELLVASKLDEPVDSKTIQTGEATDSDTNDL